MFYSNLQIILLTKLQVMFFSCIIVATKHQNLETMKKAQFFEFTKQLKENTPPEEIESAGGFNAFLMEIYKAETGQKVFRTFNAWKKQGYKVKKGESSYPVYSRPLNIIKAEKAEKEGKDEVESTGAKRFGIAHLFHFGQVEPMEQEATATAKAS